MKKLILCVAMACAAFSANAATTISLDDVPSCTNGVCLDVGNDAGLSIEYIAASSTWGRVTTSIGGVIYDSGIHAIAIPVGFTTINNAYLYGPDGTQLVVNLNYRTWQTICWACRYHTKVTHWELLKGTILK